VGGLVANLEGQIVGMINSNLSVLPAEDMQTAVSAYLKNGKIQRPSFGIKYLNLSNQLAQLKNLPQGGALVVSVEDGSAAKKAGILPNDLIISADNQDLSNNEFEKVLNAHTNTDLPITVMRGTNKIQLTVKLGTD
jgi:serine protease Do